MDPDLKNALAYDPNTGRLEWSSGYRFAGKEAGSKSSAYIQVTFRQVGYYAHRIAWYLHYGTVPDHIDHINGNKHDNRICNLRSVSKAENHRNTKRFSTSTTGHAGVSFHRQLNKWRAYITVDSRQVNLGCYTNQQDAIAARKAAEVQYGFHANHGRDQ